jgi:hypothetical protein
MRAHLFVVCVVLARAQRRQCWRSDCGQQYLGPREDEWSIPRDCTVLNLQMSKVDDENAPALARELAALTSPGLEELDIGWNDLSDVGATLVAEALLPHASTLRSVRLAHNHIGDSGAMALASALVTHMKLMTLDLSANSVSAKGVAVVRALTAALPHLSSVRLDAEGDPAPPELGSSAPEPRGEL